LIRKFIGKGMMTGIDERETTALQAFLLSMGDDELILGQRDSEWCGHAPILEEDIAFANIALDEIGHANIWYGLFSELSGEDPETFPDHLVFFREPDEYRNLQLVEMPNGDWAFSMLRQYLFDAAELCRLGALTQSSFDPLRQSAAKILKEEIYHQRHTQAWVVRLGLGTEESHRRLQQALDEIWPYTEQFFIPIVDEHLLVAKEIIPETGTLQSCFLEKVLPVLRSCSLSIPEATTQQPQRDIHTRHLAVLLREMQSVARMVPQARW
jgi:ring-1,2-phenylacetyl-CoA epoxidase subunit PaaC